MLSRKEVSAIKNDFSGSTETAVKRLHDLGLSDRQIATQLKITTATVSRLLGYN